MSLGAVRFQTGCMAGSLRMGASALRVLLAIGILLSATVLPARSASAAEAEDLGAYDPEAVAAARTRLTSTLVAVFAGARHGFVKGERLPLDPRRWETEAIFVKRKVMVPERFALSAFGIKHLPWFGLGIAKKKNMVCLEDLAGRLKKKVFTDERGLVIVTDAPLTLSDSQLIDSIITLFDTPEKFADPQIAYRSLPSLKAWGKLTNQIKITDKQSALFEGPESNWHWIPRKSYDYAGLRMQELASKVPEPGVHPRLLFGPDDVPMVSSRVRSSVTGAKSLIEMEFLLGRSFLDPNSSDGRIFTRLASGDLEGLVLKGHLFEGQTPGVDALQGAYLPNCLTSMALYCLIVNDDDLGRRTAAAIYHYYKLLEPEIDRLNAQPDVYRAHWYGMKDLVGHRTLALAYDFAAKWMTDEQKTLMRRLIAKAVGGRRGYGQDGPPRMRDMSWVMEDLTIFLANLVIEGEEGFDPEVHARGVESVRAFLQWGIDRHGLLTESNGTNAAGLDIQFLAMVALARRGDNLFGHPYWRRMIAAQVQCTAPDRTITASRGTAGDGPLSRRILNACKIFYPADKSVDYLLGRTETARNFDGNAYRRQLAERSGPLRLPGPTGFAPARSFLYDADGAGATRGELDLPLDFSDPVQGMFSSRSDNSETALWINMQARPDLYLDAGSRHHDAGSFYLQADGVTWGREGLSPTARNSQDHSIVLIDGVGQDKGLGAMPTKVEYVGATLNAQGAIATADLSEAYDAVWTTCIESWDQPYAKGYEWEIETDPDVVKMFKGTQRYRINYGRPPLSNPWFPTLRARCNPVQYAYRSAGLVRGKHPYAVLIDDIRKDDDNHRYDWQMIGAFYAVALPGLDPEDLVLSPKPAPDVVVGDPLLLLREVGPSPCTIENNLQQHRTIVSTDAVDPRFRIVMIPFRMGQTPPRTNVEAATGAVALRWEDQADRLEFELGREGRTRLRVLRDGDEILRSK